MEQSGWLDHLSGLLAAASDIAARVAEAKQTVLVHVSAVAPVFQLCRNRGGASKTPCLPHRHVFAVALILGCICRSVQTVGIARRSSRPLPACSWTRITARTMVLQSWWKESGFQPGTSSPIGSGTASCHPPPATPLPAPTSQTTKNARQFSSSSWMRYISCSASSRAVSSSQKCFCFICMNIRRAVYTEHFCTTTSAGAHWTLRQAKLIQCGGACWRRTWPTLDSYRAVPAGCARCATKLAHAPHVNSVNSISLVVDHLLVTEGVWKFLLFAASRPSASGFMGRTIHALASKPKWRRL